MCNDSFSTVLRLWETTEDSDATLHYELPKMKSCTTSPCVWFVHRWFLFPGGTLHWDIKAPPLRLMPSGVFPCFSAFVTTLEINFNSRRNNKQQKRCEISNKFWQSYEHASHVMLRYMVCFCPCPIRPSVSGALAAPHQGSSCSVYEWWRATHPLCSDPIGSLWFQQLTCPSQREWAHTRWIVKCNSFHHTVWHKLWLDKYAVSVALMLQLTISLYLYCRKSGVFRNHFSFVHFSFVKQNKKLETGGRDRGIWSWIGCRAGLNVKNKKMNNLFCNVSITLSSVYTKRIYSHGDIMLCLWVHQGLSG